MIQTNELRVGNYVWSTLEGGKKEHKVEARDIALGSTGKIHSFSPIELDEHYLIRLGFRRSGVYFFHENRPEYFTYIELGSEDRMCGYSYCLDDDRGSYKPIRYVHELQNLFFGLCGIELSVLICDNCKTEIKTKTQGRHIVEECKCTYTTGIKLHND